MAKIVNGSAVELVRVVKCNSKRVVSYLRPGRVKAIAPKEGEEMVTIADSAYQKAAGKLYDSGRTEFADTEEACRAITDAS